MWSTRWSSWVGRASSTEKITILAALITLAFAAHAAVLKTDPAKSTVSATFKQMNAPIEDKFKKLTAIERLTYNVGEGQWKATGMVADDIAIKFHVVAGQ